MNEEIEHTPINVHVVSSNVKSIPNRTKYKTAYSTVVLSASEPARVLLPQSDERVIAHIQALDNDVVIGASIGTVQAATNLASGTPNPSGTLVPAKSTGGSAAVYPIMDNDTVYVGATTTSSSSRVAVSAVYRVE